MIEHDNRWIDIGGGNLWEFSSADGRRLAEVKRDNSGLWLWRVFVPPQYRTEPHLYPEGYVHKFEGAKFICELVLVHTGFMRW